MNFLTRLFLLLILVGISVKVSAATVSADTFKVIPSSSSSYTKIGNGYFRQWNNVLYYKGSANGSVVKKSVSQKNASALTDGTTVYYKGRYQTTLYQWIPKANKTTTHGSLVSGSYMVPLIGGDTVNLYYHQFNTYAKCDVYKYSLKTKKSTLICKNAAYIGCYKNNIVLEGYNGMDASPLYCYDRNTGKLLKKITSKMYRPTVSGGKVYFAYQTSYSSMQCSGSYYARSYDLTTKKYTRLSPTIKDIGTVMDVNSKYFSYRQGDRLSGKNYKYTYATKKTTVIS